MTLLVDSSLLVVLRTKIWAREVFIQIIRRGKVRANVTPETELIELKERTEESDACSYESKPLALNEKKREMKE